MKRIRDAAQIIATLDGGDLVQELSDQLQEVLKTLKEHAGARKGAKAKGKVALTLDLCVEGGVVTIEAEVTTKKPKPARGSSVFFVLDDGALSTEHPRQVDMFAGPRSVDSHTSA